MPKVTTSLLFNPDTYPYYETHLHSFQSAAKTLALTLTGTTVRTTTEIEQSIAKVAQQPVGALLAAPDPFMNVHRGSVIIRHYAHRLLQHLTIDDASF